MATHDGQIDLKSTTGLAVDGVKNLIHNCAQVKFGERVVLVHERNTMEDGLVTLITDVIQETNASSNVIWLEAEALQSPRKAIHEG